MRVSVVKGYGFQQASLPVTEVEVGTMVWARNWQPGLIHVRTWSLSFEQAMVVCDRAHSTCRQAGPDRERIPNGLSTQPCYAVRSSCRTNPLYAMMP